MSYGGISDDDSIDGDGRSYSSYEMEQLLTEKLALLEKEKQLRDGLGYRYAHKFYKFQREFIESTNKMNLLVAANQLGKSSSGIMRMCEKMFTTDAERIAIWGDKYKPGKDKLVLWYFYPDFTTATTAFVTTWQKYLPSGPYLDKDNPEIFEQYGWKAYFSDRKITQIEFRDGIMQFKAYGQSSINLQSTTCYEAITDEELPYEHYGEIRSRMNYTGGSFSMVFTATLGQKEWYDAMERRGEREEMFPNANKWNVSLWDCMKYEDDSQSPWTRQRIIAISNQYGTEEEVQKRVEGRFVVDRQALVFSGFINKNIVEPCKVPDKWEIYCGIDIGSGGKNHKSAICFTAVNPEKTKAYVIDLWREDILPTDPEVVLRKFYEMREALGRPINSFYDYGSVDFEKLVNANEVKMMYRASKHPEEGIGTLNALMKNNMLQFFNHKDVSKLFQEFRLVRNKQAKNGRRDDACFTKGNSVATNYGFKDISKLRVGDRVLTRDGFRDVVDIGVRKADVKVYEIGNHVARCTPDHKFIVNSNEKKQIQRLTHSDTFNTISIWRYLLWQFRELRQFFLMELSSEGIQIQIKESIGTILHLQLITGKREWDHCTKKYGEYPKGKYQKGLLFTILTIIHLIMILKTLSVWTLKSILDIMVVRIMRPIKSFTMIISERLKKRQRNGMQAKKVENGTLLTEKNHGKKGCIPSINVTNVEKFTHLKSLIQKMIGKKKRVNFAPISANQNFAGKVVSIILRLFAEGVKNLLQEISIIRLNVVQFNVRQDYVYNVTVDDNHEYTVSLCVVANCDALRYSLCRVDFDFSNVDDSTLIGMDRYVKKREAKEADYYEERSLKGFKQTKKKATAERKRIRQVQEDLYEEDSIFDY